MQVEPAPFAAMPAVSPSPLDRAASYGRERIRDFRGQADCEPRSGRDAQWKTGSVRHLDRTSLPTKARWQHMRSNALPHILGGRRCLAAAAERLVSSIFLYRHARHLRSRRYRRIRFLEGGTPATAFLLELIARLQAIATVPMIDVRASACCFA